MYGGLAAGLLVANQLTYLREAFPSPRTVPGLLLAGGLLVITGIIDDRWGMGAISKLAAQVGGGRHPGAGARWCSPGCPSRAAVCSYCRLSWA